MYSLDDPVGILSRKDEGRADEQHIAATRNRIRVPTEQNTTLHGVSEKLRHV